MVNKFLDFERHIGEVIPIAFFHGGENISFRREQGVVIGFTKECIILSFHNISVNGPLLDLGKAIEEAHRHLRSMFDDDMKERLCTFSITDYRPSEQRIDFIARFRLDDEKETEVEKDYLAVIDNINFLVEYRDVISEANQIHYDFFVKHINEIADYERKRLEGHDE